MTTWVEEAVVFRVSGRNWRRGELLISPLPQFVIEASSLVVCLMIRHDTQMIIWEQAQGQLPIMTVSCSYYPPTSAANSHNCPHFDICFKILQHKTDVVWLCRGVAQNSVGPFSFPDPYLSRIWVFFLTNDWAVNNNLFIRMLIVNCPWTTVS